MYRELRRKVLEANLLLPKYGLVTFTWGNVSEIDRKAGAVAIKPSGVEYDEMTADDIVVVDLDGRTLEGSLKPSSDLDTHLMLYRAFSNIGGVVHTHSRMATSWAQAGRDIPAYGTTHGDYFYGSIPCTRPMMPDEISKDYELNTGKAIIDTFHLRGLNPDAIPGALVFSHGPFAWGKDAHDAVHNGVVLEELAFMAAQSESIKGKAFNAMQKELLDKHFLRKHGPHAYYGQKV